MNVIVEVLAAYRILRFLQLDSMLKRPRQKLWEKMSQVKVLRYWRPLLECPWCLAPYIAAGVIFAHAFFGEPWRIFERVLALAAIVGFLGWLDGHYIG